MNRSYVQFFTNNMLLTVLFLFFFVPFSDKIYKRKKKSPDISSFHMANFEILYLFRFRSGIYFWSHLRFIWRHLEPPNWPLPE